MGLAILPDWLPLLVRMYMLKHARTSVAFESADSDGPTSKVACGGFGEVCKRGPDRRTKLRFSTGADLQQTVSAQL